MRRKLSILFTLVLSILAITASIAVSAFAAQTQHTSSNFKATYTPGQEIVTSATELTNALSNLGTDDANIAITQNLNLSSTLNISGNQQTNVVLDLGSSSLTSSNNGTLLNVSGNIDLTITGDSGSTISSQNIGVNLDSNFTGTLTVENVHITATTQALVNASKGTLILRNCTIDASANKSNAIENSGGGILLIYDCDVTSTKNGYCVKTSNSGSVTKIYGGVYKLSTEGGGQMKTLYNTSPGTTTVYSGQFADTTYKSFIASTSTDQGQSGTYYVVVDNS